MRNEEYTVIIVAGCQRSGTCLTGQILGAHPQALLIDETDKPYDCLNHLLLSGGELEQASFAECINLARRKYATPELRFTDIGGIQPKVTHIVFQAPNMTYDLPAVLQSRRPLRAVIPLRDARDVVSSMKELTHIPMVQNQLRLVKSKPDIAGRFQSEIDFLEDGGSSETLKMAIVWQLKTGLCQELAAESDQAHCFHYESLVQDPNSWCARLLESAGLDADPACARCDTVYQGFGAGRTHRTRPIDQHSVGRWRSQLSAAEAAEIWATTSELMLDLGYTEAGFEA